MLRHFHIRREAIFAIAGLAAAWQVASYCFPAYLCPSIVAIAESLATIFASPWWIIRATSGGCMT